MSARRIYDAFIHRSYYPDNLSIIETWITNHPDAVNASATRSYSNSIAQISNINATNSEQNGTASVATCLQISNYKYGPTSKIVDAILPRKNLTFTNNIFYRTTMSVDPQTIISTFSKCWETSKRYTNVWATMTEFKPGSRKVSEEWLKAQTDCVYICVSKSYNWPSSIQTPSVYFYVLKEEPTIVYYGPSNITLIASDLNHLFENCYELQTVDFENFSWGSQVNLAYTFANCSRLTSITNFYNCNASDLTSTFQNCTALQEISDIGTLTCFNTNLLKTFHNCNSLKDLNLVGIYGSSNSTQELYQFLEGCNNLITLTIPNLRLGNNTCLSGLFYGCRMLESLDLSNWDLRNCLDFSYMFYNCINLKTIILPTQYEQCNLYSRDTTCMFYNCYSLKSVAFPHNLRLRMRDCSYMFFNCRNLTEIDLSEWNCDTFFSYPTLNSMFSNCYSLQTILLPTECFSVDEEAFTNDGDTPVVTTTCNYATGKYHWCDRMFFNCQSLTTIYSPNWSNIESIKTAQSKTPTYGVDMFLYCYNLSGRQGTKEVLYDESSITYTNQYFTSYEFLS